MEHYVVNDFNYMPLKWKFESSPFVCTSHAFIVQPLALSVCVCVLGSMSSMLSVLSRAARRAVNFLCAIYLVGEFRNSIGFIWNCNCVIAIERARARFALFTQTHTQTHTHFHRVWAKLALNYAAFQSEWFFGRCIRATAHTLNPSIFIW